MKQDSLFSSPCLEYLLDMSFIVIVIVDEIGQLKQLSLGRILA